MFDKTTECRPAHCYGTVERDSPVVLTTIRQPIPVLCVAWKPDSPLASLSFLPPPICFFCSILYDISHPSIDTSISIDERHALPERVCSPLMA